MENRSEQAMVLHNKGFNCAQCVVCVYADKLGIDQNDAFRMMEGFGFGMGKAKSTCGALSGAIAAAGLIGSTGTAQPTSKKDTYRKAGELAEQFDAEVGATICGDIKGMATGKMLRSCPDCIAYGCELVAKMLEDAGIE